MLEIISNTLIHIGLDMWAAGSIVCVHWTSSQCVRFYHFFVLYISTDTQLNESSEASPPVDNICVCLCLCKGWGVYGKLPMMFPGVTLTTPKKLVYT